MATVDARLTAPATEFAESPNLVIENVPYGVTSPVIATADAIARAWSSVRGSLTATGEAGVADVAEIPATRAPLRASIALETPRTAHPRLTVQVRQIVELFWHIIASKAVQSGFDRTIEQARVDVEDPSEDDSQVVIRVYSSASAVQVLAFWDSLAIEIDQWYERLGPRERELLTKRVGARFHWKAL